VGAVAEGKDTTVEESPRAMTKRSATLGWRLVGCRQRVPVHQHVHPPFGYRLGILRLLLEITHVFITVSVEAPQWDATQGSAVFDEM
jgi:hypothetical protein